jgi:hypothetical protein
VAKSTDAVGPGPGSRRRNESLFRRVGHDVPHASMGSLLIDDRDGPISARPDALWPIMQSSDLLGDVRIYKLHESGELLGIGRRKEKMNVGRQASEGIDDHVVDRLGLADDTKDEVGQLR